jgi:hypothetical protein
MTPLEEAKWYAQQLFRLNPPLPEAQLLAFESKYGVTLPDDYRDFALNICDGGKIQDAGGNWHTPLMTLNHIEQYEGIALLNSPFPHTSDWNDQSTLWLEDDDACTYFDDVHMQGSFPFFSEGCGYYHYLVVTGDARGTVWIDGRVSDQGIMRVGLTFLRWFKWWDETLQSIRKRSKR